MSNMTEENAKWLSAQRKLVAKEIKELSEMMVEYTRTASDRDEYSINFGLSSTNYEVQVFDKSFSIVEKVESWCICSVLEHFMRLDRDYVSEKVQKLIGDIRNMKLLVKKYVKLNQSKL